MLIIAIPKSGSSSLLVSVGKATRLRALQTFPGVLSEEIRATYPILSSYHSDIREQDAQTVREFCASNRLYKQHIPPTSNNLKLLEQVKAVILLRSPQDIVDAYYRAEKSSIHTARPEFAGCGSVEEWRRRAHSLGLYAELGRFYEGYVSANNGNWLVIEFDQIVTNFQDALCRIMEHWQVNDFRMVETLSKKRYSRAGVIIRLIRLLAPARIAQKLLDR